jgi:hypothetical protein
MILFIDMKGKLPKLERRLLALLGSRPRVCSSKEQRTFLAVNKFHYLTHNRPSAVN